MMDLKAVLPAAELAPPAIPLQDSSAKSLVSWPIQTETRTFLAEHAQAGIRKRDEKVCFNWSGNNSYSLHIERSVV